MDLESCTTNTTHFASRTPSRKRMTCQMQVCGVLLRLLFCINDLLFLFFLLAVLYAYVCRIFLLWLPAQGKNAFDRFALNTPSHSGERRL